mmetsp:Transcript_43869/g.114389  ORF Transcript_43869/g.114389 Transcript_43869/m.114389 type:complete len:164 (+) Transcript_43869:273-764(+)
MLVLSPSCLFHFSTYRSSSPVITLEKGVTAPTFYSTTGMIRREGGLDVLGTEELAPEDNWFHLEVATSFPISGGGEAASLSLLSISDGGFVGHPSMLLPPFPREIIVQSSNGYAALNFALRTEHLACPFGYAYTYTITFRQEYDTRLENEPYLCSNPNAGSAS